MASFPYDQIVGVVKGLPAHDFEGDADLLTQVERDFFPGTVEAE